MSERIEPALTAEEWAEGETITPDHVRVASTGDELEVGDGSSSTTTWCIGRIGMPQVIALANDVLPDSDHRKITRGMLRTLRRVADFPTDPGAWRDDIEKIADALESYLRPGKP